jgi:hypothetical protein
MLHDPFVECEVGTYLMYHYVLTLSHFSFSCNVDVVWSYMFPCLDFS